MSMGFLQQMFWILFVFTWIVFSVDFIGKTRQKKRYEALSDWILPTCVFVVIAAIIAFVWSLLVVTLVAGGGWLYNTFFG